MDVKKALPKNEMDRMNNRGGGRDMGSGPRGFGPRGDRGSGGPSWWVITIYSMQIKFHSMGKLTPIHYNQFRMFFFSRNSIFFCLSDFHRGNNNRNNNSDGWMPNNTYSNNGGFNSNNNGNWGGNSQPTPWNNNSSNSQGKNQMNATCW